MLNIILMTALFFTFIIFLIKRSSTKALKNPPPSPSSLPIIGNLHQIDALPHRSLRRLAQRHGDVLLVHFGSVPVLVVSSTDAAREVIKTHDAVFASRPRLNPAHKLLYNSSSVSTSPYGEYWRQVRSICVMHLLSATRVKTYRPIREQETASFLEAIGRLSSLSLTINLSEMLSSLTDNIICRVSFGKKYSKDDEAEKKKVKDLILEFSALLGRINIGDYIPLLSWVSRIKGFEGKVDRVFKAMDDYLERILKEHIDSKEKLVKNEEDKDFIDVLLDFHGDEKKDGIYLNRDSVKALIIDMYFGATDSIYAALEWTMAELLRHPMILKQVQAEVDKIVAGKPHVSETDVDKMHYLRAVIKESFRLHPPSPLTVPHESMQDCKIQGFDVAPQTRVIVNLWAVGRDPKSWDDPEEFKPERFLKLLSIDLKGDLLPFGNGRRVCPGATFSVIVVQYVLANMVHKFDWTLPDGKAGESLDLTETGGFSVHMKEPLHAIATPRRFD